MGLIPSIIISPQRHWDGTSELGNVPFHMCKPVKSLKLPFTTRNSRVNFSLQGYFGALLPLQLAKAGTPIPSTIPTPIMTPPAHGTWAPPSLGVEQSSPVRPPHIPSHRPHTRT